MTNTKYIAAQGKHTTHAHSQCIIAPNSGPLPNTLEDFWKMIMENKLRTIVMLTKCFEERVSCYSIHYQIVLSSGSFPSNLVATT